MIHVRTAVWVMVSLGVATACASSGGNTQSGGASSSSTTSSSSGGSGSSGTGGTTTGSSSSGGGEGGSGSSSGGDAAAVCASPGTYDETVLCDRPAAYWAMNGAPATEPDLTGNGHAGTYQGGVPASASLPNGDKAADFNGSSQYLTVPSDAAFSIPTIGELTWEGWIRPDVLQFPHDSDGYVDWMGKCDSYSPTCEWEARMCDTTNSQNRCNRLSAYVFNPSAGLGSAADWQPACGLLQAGSWYHVVGEYTTRSQPSSCPTDCAGSGASCPNPETSYPGSIDIWVNGVEWSQTSHTPTGCMCQYCIDPVANGSPLNIGTMAKDTWFQGAVGKVALYDGLLSPSQIATHYASMTGSPPPAGSCANTCSL